MFSSVWVCVFMKDMSLQSVFQEEFCIKVSSIWMV